MILKILFSGADFALIKKAKLNVYGKSVPELILLARRIVTMMTANPNFTNPFPALSDITTATDDLETAYQEAQDGSHAKVALVQDMTVVLKHVLAYLESYVTNISMGNEQKILSSGMEVAKNSDPVGILPAPTNVKLTNGPNEGMVILWFKKVKHAASYNIDYYEYSNPQMILPENLEEIPWVHTNGSTKTKFTIEGLTSGNRIIVRTAALNTEGIGTWSETATIIIP